MLTKKEAQKGADELAETLSDETGGEWEAVIWENLGWHYKARLGAMSVYPRIDYNNTGNDPAYNCMISDMKDGKVQGGTPMNWSNDYYGPSPLEAVRAAVIHLMEEYNRMHNALNSAIRRCNKSIDKNKMRIPEHLTPLLDETID